MSRIKKLSRSPRVQLQNPAQVYSQLKEKVRGEAELFVKHLQSNK